MFEFWLYPVLLLTGVVAGLVDAMAGGGGLITVPVLLNCGLPPALALGTNKLQASCGSVMAAVHFLRLKAVDLRECRTGVIATAAGAVAGALCVQFLPTGLLERLIPPLLAAILLYTILRPRLGHTPHPARVSATPFFLGAGLVLGFYDGFLGPGTGSFWTVALLALRGCDFTRATATTKVMNATSNVAALALFLAAGQVHFLAGLVMGAGQLVGARIGAGLVLTRGARLVRPLFLVMVSLTLARLVWKQYLP